MGWLKDNILDVLLFVAIAAIVVAIVLFLLGINPFARKARQTTPPAGPVAEAPAPAPEPEPVFPADTGAEPVTGGEEEAAGGEVTVLPIPPVAFDEAGESGAGAAEVEGRPQQQPPGTGGAEVGGGGGEAPSGSGVYRVSVGAFSRPELALELAAKLKDQGYPVRVEVVGELSRVVVGPYGSLSEAKAAAEKLAAYQPRVYKGDTPVPSGTYLQVGAFKSFSRAEALAGELKRRGFPVVVYYRGGWVKVWVGPLDEDEVGRYRERLKEAGYEAVVVGGG